MVDLVSEHAAYADELRKAIEDVLRHGEFIMGPEVRAFEDETAAYLGAPFAVSCNSGTDALVLALRALGIGPGDEVVTSPFTFFATAEAVSAVGATPIFADIDEATFNLDPEAAGAALTERTRVILPVHLYGQPADMDAFERLADEQGLVVVEDAAQAFGARQGSRYAGTVGVCGAFSFFPSKPLGGLGDGGLAVTADGNVASRMRMLRMHGSRTKYNNEVIGYNSRLDTLQAAVLLVKLRRLDEANKARQQIAARYDGHFQGVPGLVAPKLAAGGTHVYHQYTVRIVDNRREAVQLALAARGIASMVYYPIPLHQLHIYQAPLSLPRAERAAGEVLSLPISPSLADDVTDEIAHVVVSTLSE